MRFFNLNTENDLLCTSTAKLHYNYALNLSCTGFFFLIFRIAHTKELHSQLKAKPKLEKQKSNSLRYGA